MCLVTSITFLALLYQWVFLAEIVINVALLVGISHYSIHAAILVYIFHVQGMCPSITLNSCMLQPKMSLILKSSCRVVELQVCTTVLNFCGVELSNSELCRCQPSTVQTERHAQLCQSPLCHCYNFSKSNNEW